MISKDSDQTARMRRLIRFFASRTSLNVCFFVRWLKWCYLSIIMRLMEGISLGRHATYSILELQRIFIRVLFAHNNLICGIIFSLNGYFARS